jgi:hypothetical protein
MQVTCYDHAPGAEALCMFANNDCNCGDGPAAAAVQACILQSCTVKEWLGKTLLETSLLQRWPSEDTDVSVVTMNATDTVCDRPLRDDGHILIIYAATLGPLALLAVAMRLYVAIRQRSFGYDDLFACLAVSMSVSNSIGLATSARLGLGRDIWTLTQHEITRVNKVSELRTYSWAEDDLHQVIYICQNFYFWCSGFQKLCFLFLFLRIFPSESARRLCYAGIVISIGYATGFGLTMMFACWPISGQSRATACRQS